MKGGGANGGRDSPFASDELIFFPDGLGPAVDISSDFRPPRRHAPPIYTQPRFVCSGTINAGRAGIRSPLRRGRSAARGRKAGDAVFSADYAAHEEQWNLRRAQGRPSRFKSSITLGIP
jgi:hypothetical protein